MAHRLHGLTVLEYGAAYKAHSLPHHVLFRPADIPRVNSGHGSSVQEAEGQPCPGVPWSGSCPPSAGVSAK